MAMTTARIAFLSTFYGAYDDVMGTGFRDLQLTLAGQCRSALEQRWEITDLGVVEP